MTSKTRTIEVNYLARVEGEGALFVDIEKDQVKSVQLKIFEPPRFFEGFLQGRDYKEVCDITARICGICPVAYQMSSVHALENIVGYKVPPMLRNLRRLLYCGEWIESHMLHALMLHAPDFLGFPDAIKMGAKYPKELKAGLELKKLGNEIVTVIGGREIHPINVRLGGFYRIPDPKRFEQLKGRLESQLSNLDSVIRWASHFHFPDFEREYSFVCLSHPSEYPFNEGKLITNWGETFSANEFEQHFHEVHVPYTNALHCLHQKRGAYFVGPMARFNMNFDQFPVQIQELAQKMGLELPCKNPFKSLLIRLLEVKFAYTEAIRVCTLLMDSKSNQQCVAENDESFKLIQPQKGIGHAVTEAPRGLLYHRYEIDEKGIVLKANIIPPTSQNQKTIEEDLADYVKGNHRDPDDKLQHALEQSIRNYDPCISCATHFLKMNISRA